MNKSAIEVALRIRDCLDDEESVPDNFLVLDEKKGLVHAKNNPYKFDHIFNTNAKNECIYNSLVADKIPKILQGYNVTILAYGATGSGKTYTMGTSFKPSNPGLIPLALKNIFESLQAIEHCDLVVKASFFELYMEEIKDLIRPENICSLRGEAEDLKIIGLSEHLIKSKEEAFKILESGNHARKTESTAKNSNSSRSHAVFIVSISLTDNKTGVTRKSKFQLVDLAGSERSKDTKTSGETFKQGININKSLSTLGRVILCITKKEKHIPYRDSILTRILQDSLGGNSYTVLVACINLVQTSAEETLNTLRYADSAKNIKNNPIVNKEEEEKSIQQLKSEISLLKSELVEIKEKTPTRHSLDYYKMTALAENLKEYCATADVKFTETYEKIKSLFDLLNDIISEFSEEAATNTSVEHILIRMEQIKEELKKLLDEMDTFKADQSTLPSMPNISLCSATFQISSDEPMDTDEKESYETCPENLSEEAKQQLAETTFKLENLEKMILIKESSIESCKDLQPIFDLNFNEEAYQALLDRLNVLSEEKKSLMAEKRLLKAEELAKEKDLKEKIRILEENIARLQSDIRRNDVLLDLKRKSKEKENILKKEILSLKQSKILLLKQQKLEASKFKRQAVDESKKRALLEKNYRKITFEKEKMQNVFDKKINVLKQKLENIQKQKKSQPIRIVRIKENTGNVKKDITLNEALAQVDELLSEITTQEMFNIELENYEEEMHSLIQQLDNYENKKERSDTDESMKNEEKDIRSNFEEYANKIKELKNEEFKKSTSPTNFDWVPTDYSKKVIEHIVKKYASIEADSARKLDALNSNLQKKESVIENLQDTTKILKSSVTELEKEIEKIKREYEQKILKLEREWETKILLVLENHRKFSEKSEEIQPKSPEVKKIQNFENKELKEQLSKAKLTVETEVVPVSEIEHSKLLKENEELKEQLGKAKLTVETEVVPVIETEHSKLLKENEELKAQLNKAKLKIETEVKPVNEAEYSQLLKEREELREKLRIADFRLEMDSDVTFVKLPAAEAECSRLLKEREELREKLRMANFSLEMDSDITFVKLPAAKAECSRLLKENEDLKEQLRKAQMRYEPKMPRIGPLDIKIKKDSRPAKDCRDMVGAFLSDVDESILDDSCVEDTVKKDPDWRATPVHLRGKSHLKRKHPYSLLSNEESPVTKKASVGCSCPSNCSTKRCGCKKKKAHCTKNCECNNGITCANIASDPEVKKKPLRLSKRLSNIMKHI